MILSRNSGMNQDPRIRAIPLQIVSSNMKFLSITIDEKLSFRIHCNNVAKCVLRSIRILYILRVCRLSNLIPSQVAISNDSALLTDSFETVVKSYLLLGNANAPNFRKTEKFKHGVQAWKFIDSRKIFSELSNWISTSILLQNWYH